MLKVLEFLKTKSFKELEDTHGVGIRLSKCNRFFSLNYSQIHSKDNDELANECRGLILAKENHEPIDSKYSEIIPGDLKIIAYPFNRFFNLNQRQNEKINLLDPNLKIFSKLDGTLAIVYFNEVINNWAMATRGVSEADVPLEDNLHTFRSLFDKAVLETANENFYSFTNKLDKNNTYMFELTTPFNNLVVKHDICKITLLGARNKFTYNELDISNININTPKAPIYAFADIDEAVKYVNNIDPSNEEGVVICDSNFNRLKIKNKEHCMLSKLRESLGHSDKNILNVILKEKEDDIINLVPQEIKEKIITLKEKTSKLIKYYNLELNNCGKYIPNTTDIKYNRKIFATSLENFPYKNISKTPFFLYFDKKINNFNDFINLNKEKDGDIKDAFLEKILNELQVY